MDSRQSGVISSCEVFKVDSMTITNGIITDLVIKDNKEHTSFEYHAGSEARINNNSATINSQTDNKPPTASNQQHRNEVSLKQYYEQLKKDPDIDSRQLERFLAFYMGESDREPGKTRAATWHGYFNPKERWTKWLANAYNTNK